MVLNLIIENKLYNQDGNTLVLKRGKSESILFSCSSTNGEGFGFSTPPAGENGHGSPVGLLTPHMEDGLVHLSCCSLAVQVTLQARALQRRQLPLTGCQTSSQRSAAL